MRSIITIAIVVCAGTHALADDLTGAAKAHFERGQTLSTEGRLAEARAEFVAGFDLSRRPAFLFNAAECSRLLGDAESAGTDYRRYLELEPDGKLAAIARQRLVALGLAAPTPAPVTTTEPATPPPQLAPLPPGPLPLAPVPLAPAPLAVSPVVSVDRRSETQPSTARVERAAGIAVAAVGVGLVVTGGYFAHRASTLSSEVAAACAAGCSWDEVSAKDAEGRDASQKQWVFYGIGASALAAGAVVTWLGSREHVPIAVSPIAGGGAVSWSGQW
jgi:hypothetical protein